MIVEVILIFEKMKKAKVRLDFIISIAVKLLLCLSTNCLKYDPTHRTPSEINPNSY